MKNHPVTSVQNHDKKKQYVRNQPTNVVELLFEFKKRDTQKALTLVWGSSTVRTVSNHTKHLVLRVILIVILIVTAGLRFTKLSFQSLRNDEHFSRHAAAFDSLSEVILRGGIMDKHPPGHVLLLHFWIRLFGESEWSVRVPSVLAGIATVYALYRLGRTLVSERVGIVAAGLCAMSQMPVYFSQEARAYVFLLLGSTLCAHGVVALERAHVSGGASFRLRFGVTLVAVFTAYLHYFGLLMVSLIGIYALLSLIRKHLSFADFGVPFLGSALLYLPWLKVVKTHATARSSWMPEPTERFAEIIAEHLTSKLPYVWWSLFALATAIHIFDVVRARQPAPQAHKKTQLLSPLVLTLIAWISTVIVGALVVTYTVIPVISARNLIVILPALYLLGAITLAKIDVRLFRGTPIAATIAITGLFYHLVFVDHYFTVHTKRHYRAVAAYLKAETQRSEESAFIVTEGNWDNWLNYYWEPRGNKPDVLDITGKPLRVTATTSTFSKLLAEHKPNGFWVVMNATRHMSRLPSYVEGYRSTMTKKFVGITVRRYIKVNVRDEPGAASLDGDG